MPKLLLLCEYASLNGGERSILTMLSHFSDSEFEILIAAPSSGPLADAVHSLNLEVIPISLHDADGRRLGLEECRNCIHQTVQAVAPDLVHANSLSMSRLCGPVVARLQLPSLGHLRDIIRVNRRVIGDLNCHQRLLAVSSATRQWYLDLGLDAERCHVLHNGVDLQQFQPREATGYLHRELGIPDHATLVAAIGQIGMRKGLDVLLDAAQSIAERYASVHFLVVGQRYSQKQEALEYEERLREIARQEPLAGRCHFLGLRDDIPRFFNELALLVHTARQEPLGRVLLEAAASGVSVVATDVGGTKEIFLPGSGSGRLVPVDDSSALCIAVSELLDDDMTRHRMGRIARQRAEQAFDANHAATGLLRHYRQLVGAEA